MQLHGGGGSGCFGDRTDRIECDRNVLCEGRWCGLSFLFSSYTRLLVAFSWYLSAIRATMRALFAGGMDRTMDDGVESVSPHLFACSCVKLILSKMKMSTTTNGRGESRNTSVAFYAHRQSSR
jgi:hypothetical protein